MNIRKNVLAVLGALVLAAAPTVRAAGSHDHAGHGMKDGETMTVQGEIVDMACYMSHDGKGEKHKKCAEMCIKGGSPIGLLTENGKVYLLVEDHANQQPYLSLRELAAEQARTTGAYRNKGGVQAIVVAKSEKI